VLDVPSKPAISQRRALTRERLIRAATETVAKDGFYPASVDKIADRAGLSIGALYSNFASKDDLLFAVFDEHVSWFEEEVRAAADAEDLGQAALRWLSFDDDASAQLLVFIEFWSYAVRRPKVRRQFAKRMAQLRQEVANAIEQRSASGGTEGRLDPDLLGLVVLAVVRGLALEKLADTDAVPERPIAELLSHLLTA
jgi:AcrR family transcriptional regulator